MNESFDPSGQNDLTANVYSTVPSAASSAPVGGADWFSAFVYFAATALNGLFNKKAQERQNRYNKEAAELEYQRNIEQWQRENEYNLPANQMARLLEAGINPVLAYGGSASSQAASSPQYNSPQADYSNVTMQGITESLPNLFGVISQYQKLQMNAQQLELQKLRVQEEQERSPFYKIAALIENNLRGNKYEQEELKKWILSISKNIKLNDEVKSDIETEIAKDTKDSVIERIKALSHIAGNQSEISESLKPLEKEGMKNDLRMKVLALKISRGEANPKEFQEFFGYTIMSHIPEILSGAAQGFGNLGSKWMDILLQDPTRYEDVTVTDEPAPGMKRTTRSKKKLPRKFRKYYPK